jgi:leucyl/phenylalanyl-tRNA--protein transferase
VTVYRLSEALVFPPPDEAEPDGLLAVGGDLSPQRLLLAYGNGIFPWQGSPPLWFSPDPRWVIEPGRLRMSRHVRRALARPGYQVRADTAFYEVIGACAEIERPDQDGTWITPDMREAYERLHDLGFAHSVETWCEGELAGGVYGISLGGAFFGESMFTLRPDASKVALVTLLQQLRRWSFDFLDCQVHTEHVERLGAVPWPRPRFLQALAATLQRPTRRGAWTLDA